MKKEEWIKMGETKYDAWIKRIGYTLPVMTPHTSTLETLGGIVEGSNSFIRVAVTELAKNFDS